MRLSKRLVCIFSFALFAMMFSMAPQSVRAEELAGYENEGQAVSEDITTAEEVPSPSDEAQTASGEQQTPSAAEEVPSPSDEVQAASGEQQTPSAAEEVPSPAEGEQASSEEALAAGDISLYINPSVYIESDTGIASVQVRVMFGGVAEAFINVRLQQLRDGEWITLGAGMHYDKTSPAYESYTRTWPVDSGYYYRAYAIVTLYDAQGNEVHHATQESTTIYY